ncbi:MAG TPA: hypothetical protein VIJ92_08330 [Ginsengibacter sp.]
MITNIISFPDGHFQRKKQRPLTSRMISALLAACEKQRKGIAFGPADIKGSLISLIARGLIIKKQVALPGHTKSSWQVTPEAIAMLNLRGIKPTC